MNVALIAYHRNLNKIYPPKWIEEYKQSILNQTYKAFDLYEVNYGGGDEKIFEDSNFQSKEFPTFVHVMNYLLEHLFSSGYDCVANSNCDDRYFKTWLEKMLPYIESGFDLVSCNFHLFNEDGIYHSHKFDKLNIQQELFLNHNILCHPAVCYSRRFWENGNRYIPEEIPYEDRELWKRAIKNSKFIILPDYLVNHRVHKNSVCQSENR